MLIASCLLVIMFKVTNIVCAFLILVSILCAPAHAGRLEAGEIRTINTISAATRIPTPVTFQEPFDVPPIVVAISNQEGGNSASIRITNITTTGFLALVIEPDNFDGRHIPQDVQYIAVEPGRHILPGGGAIEAGRTVTNSVQFGPGVSGTAGFTNVAFTSPMASPATVLSQLQTDNSETQNVPSAPSRPHITALTVNATTTGFQLALERSQSAIGTVLNETVGWIAFPSASNDTFPDINGNAVNWGALNSSNTVRGWSDGCFNVTLPISSSTRIAVAKKRTRFNQDGGWLRYCALGTSTIGLRVEEDTDLDNERSVAVADAESVAIIAFSRPFHANLRAEIEVTKVSATVAGTSINGFSLPGAIREYIVTIRNVGNAPPNYSSILISDNLPPETDLLVSDIGANGTGPVAINIVRGGALLGFNYTSLDAVNDSVIFLDDNFASIAPTPDANGTDGNVNILRILPSGTLEGNRGSGPGEFTLRYRARIQ
jgi:uncharacterized repeat protein (TIGR01451 family)